MGNARTRRPSLGEPRRSRRLPLLVLLSAAAIALLFRAYSRARTDAEERLYEEERVLAEQAATSLAEYLSHVGHSLDFLALDEAIAAGGEGGRSLMRGFFRSQSGMISSISRVDPAGRLTYTFPFESESGRDISSQAHVRDFLERREAFMSGIFMAVQGFKAVAIYRPVFSASEFEGGIAILLPLAQVAKRYLEGISIGASGRAYLVDSVGGVLYRPEDGYRGDPSPGSGYADFLAFFESAKRGGAGRAEFRLAASGGREPRPARELAYYSPVPVIPGGWFVVVSAPDREALAFISDFRDQWLAIVAFLLAVFALWSVSLIRAQSRLVASERLAVLGRIAASVSHRLNSPLGAVASTGESILASYRDDLVPSMRRYAELPVADRELVDRLVALSVSRLSAPGGELPFPDRAAVARSARELEAAGVGEAESTADDLADMCLLDRTGEVAELLRSEGGARGFEAARAVAVAVGGVQVIRAAARGAAAAVAAIEAYAQPDATSGRELVDVAAGIDAELSRCLPGSRSRLRLLRDFAPGAFALGSPARLALVWSSLAINAIQATGGEGELAVSTRIEGGRVEVRFTDDGPGIPPEIRDRIFEPFVSTKPEGEGLGLGLAVAKRIVEEHGGAIGFESEPGRTTFFVDLPAARAERG